MSDRSRRAVIGVLGILLVARLGASVTSTAGLGWDFANYYQTARRIRNGESEKLYRLPRATMERFYAFTGDTAERAALAAAEGPADQDVPSGRMGFIGFPLSAYLFAPIGFVAPRWALLLFKLQSAVFLIAALAVLYPAFRDGTRDRLPGRNAAVVYLGIVLLFAPFWFVFSTGGQATPLNFFLLVLFYRYFTLGHSGPAALFLSLGILVKPFFVLMLPILAIGGEWRMLQRVTGCLLLAGALSVIVLGWPLHREWIEVMREAGGGLAEPWWNSSSAFALMYSLWSIRDHQSLAPAGEVRGAIALGIVVFKALILALFASAAWRVRRARVEQGARRRLPE